MANLMIEDLLVCEMQDQKAMEQFFGGQDPCCPPQSSRLLYEYHARTEGVGTFLVGECNEMVQRFQPVYIRVYEERGDCFDRSYIGPICEVPGQPATGI
jgi:hypothetical protein